MRNKLLLVLLFFCVCGAVSAACSDDYIKEKSSDGAVIFLGGGSVWEIDSVDRVDSALWMAMDDVLACDDGYLVNKSNGEKVGAQQLK